MEFHFIPVRNTKINKTIKNKYMNLGKGENLLLVSVRSGKFAPWKSVWKFLKI